VPASTGNDRQQCGTNSQLQGIPTQKKTGWRGRIRQRLRGDRGAVTVELVIATPLLLLILLAIVQFALWSHATHIAQAAASQGLAAARVQNGTAAAGSASAQQMLDQLAQGPLTDASVSADRTATSASVRISGTATSVIPFLTLPVHAEAAGPVERFVPNVDGFTNSDAVSGGNRSG
jgi:Flp pilus assembly protein TadG